MHPSQIGPYRIENKIGAGGMGTVYVGRHTETGLVAAVKVLPASLAREEGFVARFNREIDAMKRLSNPHVVEVYESGVDAETYYFAMEYVDGETLTSRLVREKRIPWRETVDIAQQICVALKAAHDAGIIHRDLKPSNLLLAKDGTVKLTDFGVAQVFAGGKLTVTGGIIGTAEYMSPEQAQGSRATKKSDLYSLGAVMYAMLTGRPPFIGKTTLDVIQKHRHAQFDRPIRFAPDIPHWLDDLVSQLLEKDPDKRFPDAYVVSRKLQELVRKVELSSSSPTLAGIESLGEGDPGPTIVAGDRSQKADISPTLMRDLVRHEVEQAHAPGVLGRLFDNTWILIGLLVLLMAGGVLWFQSRGQSPEKQFAAGVALMDQPEGEAWIEARDRYFQPLVAASAAEWEEKVRPYLDRIALYEWKAGSTKKRIGRRRSAPASEADRFLHLARHHADAGDVAAAERTLAALSAMIEGDPEQADLKRMVDSLRESLREDRAEDAERFALASSSLRRAEELAKSGHRAEAERLWRSVIELYAGDPAAEALVQRARNALGEIAGGVRKAAESEEEPGAKRDSSKGDQNM